MNLPRSFLLLILILALGCAGGPTSTTQASKSSYEFKRLCQAVGATNGKISREQFLAAAAKLFDAYDVNRDGYITEEEWTQNTSYFEDLKSQVILFHSTGGPGQRR
jgi:hypothetical protein